MKSKTTKTLSVKTHQLAIANRLLKREVFRRLAVEESLKNKELHYVKLLSQSRLMQEQLRHLSHQILSAQENERKKISRELHDVIAQTLTGINIRLIALKKEAALNTKGLGHNIARTQRLVEKSVDIVQRFARELRPEVLDYLGLIPALHSLLKTFTSRTGVRANLTAFAGVEQLDTERRTVLFRVVQEALTNVANHAKASRVTVTIRKSAHFITLKIHDDGQSFKVQSVLLQKGRKRLGLLGMRERIDMIGGKFHVDSAPGKGTTLTAQIPFGRISRGEIGEIKLENL